MFDFSWSEIAIIVIVGLVFIRPADLPVALRTLSRGVKAVRRMASEFQGHVDEMIRDADLGEVQQQFRDIKGLNLRDRMERVIDSDGSLRRSFVAPPSLSVPPPVHSAPGDAPALPSPAIAPTLPPTVVAEEHSMPAILPPATARRLARERARWYPPSILAPVSVQHGARRVRLGDTGGVETNANEPSPQR